MTISQCCHSASSQKGTLFSGVGWSPLLASLGSMALSKRWRREGPEKQTGKMASSRVLSGGGAVRPSIHGIVPSHDSRSCPRFSADGGHSDPALHEEDDAGDVQAPPTTLALASAGGQSLSSSCAHRWEVHVDRLNMCSRHLQGPKQDWA